MSAFENTPNNEEQLPETQEEEQLEKKPFKVFQGETVFVKRSDGSIENDWMVTETPFSEEEFIKVYKEEKGDADAIHIYNKSIPRSDLEAMNGSEIDFNQAEDLDSLIKLVEKQGTLTGTNQEYSADILKEIIEKVESGELGTKMITRAGGLRDAFEKIKNREALREKPQTEEFEKKEVPKNETSPNENLEMNEQVEIKEETRYQIILAPDEQVLYDSDGSSHIFRAQDEKVIHFVNKKNQSGFSKEILSSDEMVKKLNNFDFVDSDTYHRDWFRSEREKLEQQEEEQVHTEAINKDQENENEFELELEKDTYSESIQNQETLEPTNKKVSINELFEQKISQEKSPTEILDTYKEYLSYGDINPEAYKYRLNEAGELENNSPDARYSESLSNILDSDRAESLETVRGTIRSYYEHIKKNLGLEDGYGKSDSWIYWDIAKQDFMVNNPESSSPEYLLADPLNFENSSESRELIQQIADRHIAWEICRPQNIDRFNTEKLSRRATELIQKAKDSPGSQALSSVEYSELGRLVREENNEENIFN